jgi:hypothetical protein
LGGRYLEKGGAARAAPTKDRSPRHTLWGVYQDPAVQGGQIVTTSASSVRRSLQLFLEKGASATVVRRRSAMAQFPHHLSTRNYCEPLGLSGITKLRMKMR